MRPLLLALLLTLGSLTAFGQAPDCQFTQTFTATGYGVTVSNRAVANLGTQCVTWRLSYYADNMTALSIQVEGAPDSAGAPGTFAAVPTTACSSTQQPPCTLDGSNPLTDANHATVAFRGYYAWVALHVTVFTSGGSNSKITARMYGYKGTSPSASVRSGGGGGSGVAACGTTPPTTGTAGQTCYDTAGLLWVCHPSGACTVAANWVSAVPYTGAVANVALGTHGITGAPFTGDSGGGGTTGLVPAPAAGDAAAGKYLAAGGGYGVPPGTGGAAYYQTVDNAGTPLTQRPTLNFTGSGVSCADNSGATRTDCTITGGGSSGTGSTVFSSTTTAGPNNSAAETSVIGTVTGSKTIAANTFTNGAVLQAHAQGFYSLPAVSDSLTLKMKCGSTVIGSAVLTPKIGVLTNGSWRFWLDIASIGTGAGGSFITNGLAELTDSFLTTSTAKVLNTTTVAYDFTTPCAFDVTAQWGAAQVGETIQGTNIAAWFPGAPVSSGGGNPYLNPSTPVPIVSANWSDFNMSLCTRNNSGNFEQIVSNATSGINSCGRTIAFPSGAFTRTIAVIPLLPVVNYATAGFAITDGTKVGTCSLNDYPVSSNPPELVFGQMCPSATTCSGNYSSAYVPASTADLMFFRFSDDGSGNLSCQWSPDGTFFNTIWTDKDTTGAGGYMTPTSLLYFVNSNVSNQVVKLTVIGYQ